MRFILPAFALILAACPAPETNCTAIAVGSVNVTITDGAGEAITDATARYSVDGEDPVDCESVGPEPNAFVCGWEVDGDLEITIEAPGFNTFTETVTVGADECHVIPETLDAVLVPLDCTAEVVTSVVATVVDDLGDTVLDPTVEYSTDAGTTWTACETSGPDYACGWEEPGEIEVRASAPGYGEQTATADVPQGPCHVETQFLTLELPSM